MLKNATSFLLLLALGGVRSANLVLPFEDEILYAVALVDVSSPTTQYRLVLNPGAPDTFMGAGKAYKGTFIGVDTGVTGKP